MISASLEILGVNNVGLRVADLERSLAFYRDLIGLEVVFVSPRLDDEDMLAVAGVSGGSMRMAALTVPGLGASLNLVEFDGVARTPVTARPQDPGTVHLSLRVRNVDAWCARCWSAGFAPVADPRRLLSESRSARIAFVPDPDGFYVEFVETPAG